MPLVTRDSTQSTVFRQSTSPTGAITGDIWIDTSTSPPTMKVYDGSSWIASPSITSDSGLTSSAIANSLYTDTTTNESYIVTQAPSQPTTPFKGYKLSVAQLLTYYLDDFTSYATQGAADTAWPSADTAQSRVNITNDNIGLTGILDSTNDSIVHDLGAAVSNTKFVLRFVITYSTLTVSNNNTMYFGLSSLPQTTTPSQARDFIGGAMTYTAGSKTYGTEDTDGAALTAVGTDNTQSWTPATATPYYVQIIRTSATAYTLEIFTGSDYSTGSLGQVAGTVASTTIGLQYVYFSMRNNVTEAGVQACTIDDVAVYSGVTSV